MKIINMLDDKELFFDNYNTKYLNHQYSPSEFENNIFWADKALKPIYFGSKQKFDSLQMQFVFKDAEHSNLSVFSEKLKYCRIYFEDDFYRNKYFECVLNKFSVKKQTYKIYTVQYDFDCLLYGLTHEIILKQGENYIIVYGTKQTEAIIEVENKTNNQINLVKILDCEIKNISAGEKIIIDSEKKLISSNGTDNFNRVDLIHFPRLNSGENYLTLENNASIKITYRERW